MPLVTFSTRIVFAMKLPFVRNVGVFNSLVPKADIYSFIEELHLIKQDPYLNILEC